MFLTVQACGKLRREMHFFCLQTQRLRDWFSKGVNSGCWAAWWRAADERRCSPCGGAYIVYPPADPQGLQQCPVVVCFGLWTPALTANTA